MFISIAKTGSRYTFCVGDDPNDDSGAWLSSYGDSALLGDIPATFASFGEAHAVASRLVEDRPLSVLAKKAMFYSTAAASDEHREIAEGEVVAHYIALVEIVGQRLTFLRDTDSKDFEVELGVVENEIQGIKTEVENLIPMADGQGKKTFEAISQRLDGFLQMIEQLKQPQKTASEKPLIAPSIYKTAIRAFSEAAMLAVAPLHNDVFVRGAVYIPKTATYESVLAIPEGDLVRLSFDKNLLLSNITTCGNGLTKCGGTYSGDFFVNYWEPIVNAVGHFHSKGHAIVAVAGMDLSRREKMKAFSMVDNSEAELSIDRPTVLGKKTWTLTKTAAQVTNPVSSEFRTGDEVECTAQHLPTYLGRTGTIDEIKKKSNGTICRIDFRRGIGPIWLEDKNLKKVSLGL